MKRDVEQSAGSASLYLWNCGNRLGIEHTIADDSQLPRTFRNQHVAVGQPRHAPRMRKALRNDGDLDLCRPFRCGVGPRAVAEAVGSALGEANGCECQSQQWN